MYIEDRILLFGGTFNPIHNGHLIVARHIAEEMCTEKVCIIPNGSPPHKDNVAPAAMRHEMIKLAISNDPMFETTTYEIDKTTPSYTIETVRHFKETMGIDKPYLMIGPDNLKVIKGWYKIEELMEECVFIIGGDKNMVEGLNEKGQFKGGIYMMLFQQYPVYEKMQFEAIEIPHLDIRSTIIRERVKKGLSIRHLVPDAIVDYIEINGLYKTNRQSKSV